MVARDISLIVYLRIFILTYKAMGNPQLKAELTFEDFWKAVMDNTFQKKNSHLWCYFPAGFIY